MSFSNSGKKKNFSSKGFYIALAVCLVAVGATAFTTYDSFVNYGKKNVNSATPPSADKCVENKNTNKELQGITVDENEPVKDVPSPKNDKKNQATVNVAKTQEKALIVYPCASKEAVKPFDDQAPVFSKTMGDWRTHLGVDFKSSQGEKIKSITKGTVKDIYEDPLLGKTVVIEHTNDVTAYYSGVADTTLVKKDDPVDSGQEIASVNDVPSEILDGFHLHFAIKKDDKFINPMPILENK